jgi:hypothetical protein
MSIEPELPELEVPVLNNNKPLDPDWPALAVDNRIEPLVDIVPIPLVIRILPPVTEEESPEDMITSPPTPLSPDPTRIKTDPPCPDEEDPEFKVTMPLDPSDEVPLPTKIAPLTPELDVPVLSTSEPLEPELPAFEDMITILPLVDTLLYPLLMLTEPPLAEDEDPDDIDRMPPDPLSLEPTVT